MSESDLTILTVVENDNGIFDLMMRSLDKFTSPKPNIIIANNKPNNPILDKYKNIPNITIINNTPKLAGGSNRHGTALSAIFPLVKTKKTAIIESDCVLVDYGWEDLCGKKMLAAIKIVKAEPFYHIAFVVLETEILKGMDFGPDKPENRRVNKSYPPEKDVGYKINKYVKEQDIFKMEFIDCKTGRGKILSSKFQSDEFWKNGKPILLHFGRGSNIAGKSIRKGFDHPSKQLVEWKKIAENILK